MRLISRLEEQIERVFENGVASFMRSRLQPVEIAKKLAKSMETHQSIGVGKTYVPNSFEVHLSTSDYALLAPGKGGYERDLSDYLVNFARQRGYTLKSRPTVQLVADQMLGKRELQIAARLLDIGESVVAADPRDARAGYTTRLELSPDPPDQAVRSLPPAYLLVNDGAGPLQYAIHRLPLSLGRALDNDVVLDDRRVSRHHAQIRELNQRYCLVDLDSTNGTFVNSERITRCMLQNRDIISLGGMELSLVLQEEA